MSAWEALGKSDDWYTPKYIFDALGCRFDLDVAAPFDGPRHAPCEQWLCADVMGGGLNIDWWGYVWMNPPFGGRNGIEPWLEKFIRHGNGIALTPDRTSAPWFRRWAPRATSMLFLPKVKFERPDGTIGKSPSTGTALWALGMRAHRALGSAQHLGVWMLPQFSAAKSIDDVLEAGVSMRDGLGAVAAQAARSNPQIQTPTGRGRE